MDEKLSKELDIIIESKIGDLWSSLPPEARTGIAVGGVVTAISVSIPVLIAGIRSLFNLFSQKCKHKCDELRGDKQYNICYYSCKRVGIKQCITKLQVSRSRCKNDKCRKKLDQEIAIWKNKLVDIEKLIKEV